MQGRAEKGIFLLKIFLFSFDFQTIYIPITALIPTALPYFCFNLTVSLANVK